MSDLPEENTGKSKNGFFVIVIILLLVGMAYMAYVISQTKVDVSNWQAKNKKLEKNNKELSAMLEEFGFEITDDIKQDLKQMLAAYNEMQEKGIGDADSIAAYKARIDDLMEQVERGKWTASELMRLRKENESLRQIAREYIVKYDSLNTITTQLREDNRVKDETIAVKDNQLDEQSTIIDKQEEQIKIGQKLQAFSFTSGGEKQKLNGTLEETNRSKNCVRIFSRFTLSENKLTPSGKKVVYMQVIAPNGKTLQSSSGNYVETDKGKMPYSDKNEVDYQNQRTDMAIYYRIPNEGDLEKGNYKINIYCQGQLIGSDSFSLK